MPGRPPFEWTEDMDREILDRLMDGEALSDICGTDRDDWLPSERTFYKRLSEDDSFAQEYARAREVQAHREADEIKEIADKAKADDYNVARLRIDARKWRASKMAPKKYGDKVQLEHESPDGTMTPQAAVALTNLSDEELTILERLTNKATNSG